MPNLTEQVELFCRSAIAEKAASAWGVSYAIAEPSFFAGKEDFAAQVGVTNANNSNTENAAALKNLLCDFVMVIFGRFEDTPMGCRDKPVVKVTYDLLVFQEFRKGLEKQSGAANRHIAAVLQIRESFLHGWTLQQTPRIRHSPASHIGKTIWNRPTEYLPGVPGFYTNLQTTVEVF